MLGVSLLGEATENCCSLLDVTYFGWKVSDGFLEIDWDDPLNIAKV